MMSEGEKGRTGEGGKGRKGEREKGRRVGSGGVEEWRILASISSENGKESSDERERLVGRLRVENASLRRENRYLRRVTRESRQGRLLRRTHADARQLLVWRFAGMQICRRECGAMGMSQRRWQWARALLLVARLHDGQDLVLCEFAGALQALEASVHHLEQKGLAALRLRMPRSAFGRKVGSGGVEESFDKLRSRRGEEEKGRKGEGGQGR